MVDPQISSSNSKVSESRKLETEDNVYDDDDTNLTLSSNTAQVERLKLPNVVEGRSRGLQAIRKQTSCGHYLAALLKVPGCATPKRVPRYDFGGGLGLLT
jgi:hypothetical protein